MMGQPELCLATPDTVAHIVASDHQATAAGAVVGHAVGSEQGGDTVDVVVIDEDRVFGQQIDDGIARLDAGNTVLQGDSVG